MKIAEIIIESAEILRVGGIAQPDREAVSLLSFVLDKNRSYLIAHDRDELGETEAAHYRKLIERRAEREPFQYITGKQEFYGLDFRVSPDVLIPRPETELLVAETLAILPENARFCEVGIGSGCVSVAILHELPTATAIGLDISRAALQIAEQNAAAHRVGGRLELIESDVFSNLANDEKFDLIVSNPPYIARVEMPSLQAEVREYEPAKALTDGFDGLSIIAEIIAGAPRLLNEKGFLLLEIGHAQAAAVKNMFDREIWCEIESKRDLQSIERVIKARLADISTHGQTIE